MSRMFGDQYSSSYDLIYREKDYDGECALLEKIFTEYGGSPIRSVLDLGCGTGNHAIRMASRGFDVTGVDLSGHMLGAAERKAAAAGVALSLHRADLREVTLNRQFDAALMMFAVLGYQLENEDVIRVLRTARTHLVRGGLLMFDVWYGPAVLTQRPQDRLRVLKDDGRTLLRMASGSVDTLRHRCIVDLRLWEITAGTGLRETSEQHCMRYFFPRELALFLDISGFKLQRLGAFPDLDQEPVEQNWNVLAIAEAV